MSKTVKNWMIRDYKDLVEGVDDALIVSVRGIGANDNNEMRIDLNKKNIRISVIRNNLARHAFKESSLESLESLLTGPSALAYGAESVVDVARALVDWAKKIENLELKGAVLDGELYEGADGVRRLSKFPTRDEAIAQDVTLILSPARKLMGQVTGPGSAVAGIIKSVTEKLEKGETIASVG